MMKPFVFLCCLFLTSATPIVPIDWKDSGSHRSARNCDFFGNDLRSVKSTANECPSLCEADRACTHYSWSLLENGTCWLKKGKDVSEDKAHQLFAAHCGYIRNRINISKNKSTSQSHAGSTDRQTLNSDFFNYVMSQFKNLPYPGVSIYTQYTAARLNAKQLTNIKPILPHINAVYNDVESFRYSSALPDACKSKKGNEIKLFVAILSAPGNQERRDTIRETWLRDLECELNSFKTPGSLPIGLHGVGFVIGKAPNKILEHSIKAEREKNNDILLIDVDEGYNNLPVKTAGLFNWLDKQCKNVDYVLHLDDDLFVNGANLGSFLRHIGPRSNYLYGQRSSSDQVKRDGKFSMTFEEYPWNTYPKYLWGRARLFPGQTIRPLLAAMQSIPYTAFVDGYVTGLCAERAGIKRVPSKQFCKYVSDGNVTESDLQTYVTIWLDDSPAKMKDTYDTMLHLRKAPKFEMTEGF